ncbi:IclR family transcriptional regulator [Microbacterium sp.]|uniref:IclR family transcriptional regulator n=1 Tax=Microbacterium sp. TaxID=51671 RepID=UPI002D802422|nr:helix-turn-helix domain-containing protein [Microbacterium sp.]
MSVLDRMSAVLEAFGVGEGLGVTELARRANLPKSTVSRIAADLVAEGYLDRVDGRLYLGIRLFELGQSVEHPRRLRQAAIPTLSRLRDATGHHVHLAIADGDDALVIATSLGRSTPLAAAHVGQRLPRSTTALGAALETLRERGTEQDVVTTYEADHGDHVCVASPVFERGTVVAALSVSGGIDELDPVQTIPLVRHTAAALSRRIAAA